MNTNTVIEGIMYSTFACVASVVIGAAIVIFSVKIAIDTVRDWKTYGV